MSINNKYGFDFPAISVCTERHVFFDKHKVIDKYNLSEKYEKYIQGLDKQLGWM